MRTQGRVVVEGRIIAWSAGVLAAGPVFIASHFATDLAMLGYGAIFLTMLSIPFALLVGAVPLAAAVYAGGWLGTYHPSFRHPVVWGMVGVIAGVMIAPWIAGIVPASTRASMITGLAAALVARRFIAWIDPIAPAHSGI